MNSLRPPTTPSSLGLPRRWFQFSLRTLLIVMLVCGCGLGPIALARQKARERIAAGAAIEKVGGRIGAEGAPPVRPAWLAWAAGNDPLGNVAYVNLNLRPVGDEALRHSACFPQLLVLNFSRTAVTDAGLRHLGNLGKLQRLDLSHTQVSDRGLEHLSSLQELDTLYLHNTRVSDAGLIHLAQLKKLRWLDLPETNVTDAGVRSLQRKLPDVVIFDANDVRWPAAKDSIGFSGNLPLSR